MNAKLRDEIKQTRPFASPQHEAFLSLGRTWSSLDHQLAEALKPHGITPTQYNVLRILRGAGNDGLCRADIIPRMISRVPDATRLLDRLESVGLVERERSTTDRRFVTTRITDQGLGILGVLDGEVVELHHRQFSGLNRKELRTLIDLLDRIRSAG